MAEEPDFVKIGASEAKLLRLAEEEGIKSENDLLKIADGEDAAVRIASNCASSRAPERSRKSCSV